MHHTESQPRPTAADSATDLHGHLASVDRFLVGARSTGLLGSIILLFLQRGQFDTAVTIYTLVVLAYLIIRDRFLDQRSLPGPTPGQTWCILVEFVLTTFFVRLTGDNNAHLNLILALPAVGYAARYGHGAPLPVALGVLGSTAFLSWLRLASHDLKGLLFLTAEAAAILTMAHFAARASHRSYLLTYTLSRTAKRSRLLLEVAQYAYQSLEVEQVLNSTADAVRRLTGYRPAFFLYDAARNEFQLVVSSALSKDAVPQAGFSPEGNVFAEVLANRSPVVLTDLHVNPMLPEILRGKIMQKVGVVFPLEHAGELLGTMNLGRRDGPEFSAEEVEIFTGMAGLLGQAVHNARRHEEAERLSIQDELTGLYNHRYFQAELARQLIQASDDKSPLTLVMVDLDDFKAYNDLFGHQQGDQVLRQVGALLGGFFAPDGSRGFAARYGGEEFVMVLPGSRDDAAPFCARVGDAIRNCHFPGSTALSRGRITVSMGAAVYPVQADKRDTLLAAADTALYRAKHLGKDRCEFYTSVLDAIETDVIESSEIGLVMTIKPLVSVINGKDNYTYGHSERVVEHAVTLGKVLGLSSEDLRFISYAAFLHDLGKLEISRELLNKTDPLSAAEWQTLRSHPVWGAEMVERIASLAAIVPAIRHHHERWDGSGYPDGLSGERIPLFARIISVVDAFDAMITTRPYRREKTIASAIAEIAAQAGSQFDPVIARAFCSHQENRDEHETRSA